MRYIRQEIFREIGKKGQEKLSKSTVAVVGIGALGSNSAELLARSGVGKLLLVDRDVVELSNLQRQRLFDESDVGKPKAAAAKEHLSKINSEIKIDFCIDDLNFDNIGIILGTKLNLILDCTDNLETRFLINDFSQKNSIPFVYSSAVGSKGYVFSIIPCKTACLRCFLKKPVQLDTCGTEGVLNTITSLISSTQASETIKILLNRQHEESLLFFDIWKNELLKIKVTKRKNCPCCIKSSFEYLSGEKASRTIKMCGNDIYQIRGRSTTQKEFDELKKRLKKAGKIIDMKHCVNFDSKVTLFLDGRALVKAKDETEARSLYSKLVGN
jgi:adenylyltransferase/sulfurtransferase